MSKGKKQYVCQNCGHTESKWTGRCVSCGEWNSFVEEVISVEQKNLLKNFSESDINAVKISEVDYSEKDRIPSGFQELDRVLGGGFVDEEVLLLSGEPGVGKSTLLLQIAHNLSKNKRILYVSGEESAKQVAMRAKRLFPDSKNLENLDFLGNASINVIESNISSLKPEIVIIDSIQTIYDESVGTLPGGLSQVKRCATKLVTMAKQTGFICILIGHINKDGKVAGPKVLEHVVDCVIQLEGHKSGEYRILRSLKNRFGSTGEVGIFNMAEDGLQDSDRMKSFLTFADSKAEIGIAKTMVVEGSRPIVLDIQSLSSKTIFPYPKRVSEGISATRLQVLGAIIENLKLAKLVTSDIYLRTSGGYVVKDYVCADLAIVASLLSSYKNLPMPQNYVFVGEVALNGSVHTPGYVVPHINEILQIAPGDKVIVSEGLIKDTKLNKSSLIGVANIRSLLKLLS